MSQTGGAMLPPLTVITPVYNGAAWIADTVRSVLAQGDAVAIQYIVLDDGSTDTTLDVLAPFTNDVTVVSHPNMGEARTVNRGAELAEHDLIAIVNADDPVLPGWARTMTEVFVEDTELSAAYPDWCMIDADDRVVREVRTHEFDYSVLFGQHFCIPGPGAVLRRSHLPPGEMLRDPARRTSADYDLWLRLGLHGRIRRVPHVLATWRRHATGTSSAGRDLSMAEDKIGTIRSFVSRPGLPPSMRALAPQAMSAAYLNAALLALRAPDVPALRYALLSYWHKPLWPSDIVRQQRRSLPHLAYAAAQPVSGWLHSAISPLLPPHLSRRAMLSEQFGASHVA